MAKKGKVRNRAAQDATLVNVRALKKRVAKLESDLAVLRSRVGLAANAVLRLAVRDECRTAVSDRRRA